MGTSVYKAAVPFASSVFMDDEPDCPLWHAIKEARHQVLDRGIKTPVDIGQGWQYDGEGKYGSEEYKAAASDYVLTDTFSKGEHKIHAVNEDLNSCVGGFLWTIFSDTEEALEQFITDFNIPNPLWGGGSRPKIRKFVAVVQFI